MMGFGIALTAAGGAAMAIGSTIYLMESPLFCHQSCDREVPAGTVALYIAGAISLGIGIPLLVYGAKKVPAVQPPERAARRFIGEPGGPGWRWRF
jgi:hypothetical protein